MIYYKTQRGSALVLGFALALVLLGLALAFASTMTSNQLRMESDVAGERAYQLAQTANTVKIQRVWAEFKGQPATERIPWLGGEDLNGNKVLDTGEDAIKNAMLDIPHAPDYQDPDWINNDAGYTCTRVKPISMAPQKWVLVRFTSWARVQDQLKGFDVVRKVQRVVRFSLKRASVFDFAYFATNYGVIDGNKVSINGPVGSNGNLSLVNNPLINGRIYVTANSETGAMGEIKGISSFSNITEYKALLSQNSFFRPTTPTAQPEDQNSNRMLDVGEDINSNGSLDSFRYDLGFEGKQEISLAQPPVTIPMLGDLSVFKGYSQVFIREANASIGEVGGQVGGMVKQLKAPGLDPAVPGNYNILINKVYGDNGETGFKGTVDAAGVTYTPLKNKIDSKPENGWKNGNVALIGTPQQPLIISGPVVVTNDLAIKGTIMGQGTFFVGRNTHILGDVVYKNPPVWKPNDTKFGETAALNRTKDFVGFGSRGNIILGNYVGMDTSFDKWNIARQYIIPPHTKPQYVYNKGDGQIGYGDDDEDDGIRSLRGRVYGLFPGNYTFADGNKSYLDNDTVPLIPNRAYYQSTFSKQYMNQVATKPKNMHGIYYSGHAIAGRADNLTVFGSIITQDDGIISDGTVKLIYDVRASQIEPSTYINLFLPSTAGMDVVYWKDIAADQASPTSPDW